MEDVVFFSSVVAVSFLPEQSRRSVSCVRKRRELGSRSRTCSANTWPAFLKVCFAMGNLLLYCL